MAKTNLPGRVPEHGYILLVEDDEQVANLVQSTLQDHRYRVVAATTCLDAFVNITKEQPSLLLLDISLPDGNGLSLLADLRDGLLTETVPVIVVSSMPVSRSEMRRLGIQKYVAKPFSVPGLVLVVESYLCNED